MAVKYEKTWETVPASELPQRSDPKPAPTLPREKKQRQLIGMPTGSVTRLILGAITIAIGAYAISMANQISTLYAIGSAFGADGLANSGDLVLLAGLTLVCGVLMVGTRWTNAGGIVTGIVMICGAGYAMSIQDGFGLCDLLTLWLGVAGLLCVVVSAIWGGTISKI